MTGRIRQIAYGAALVTSGVWLVANGIAFFLAWLAYDAIACTTPRDACLAIYTPEPGYSLLALSYIASVPLNMVIGTALLRARWGAEASAVRIGRALAGASVIGAGGWFALLALWPLFRFLWSPELFQYPTQWWAFSAFSYSPLHPLPLYSLIAVPLVNIAVGMAMLLDWGRQAVQTQALGQPG